MEKPIYQPSKLTLQLQKISEIERVIRYLTEHKIIIKDDDKTGITNKKLTKAIDTLIIHLHEKLKTEKEKL